MAENLLKIEKKIDSVVMQPLKDYIKTQRNVVIDLYTTMLNKAATHAAYFEPFQVGLIFVADVNLFKHIFNNYSYHDIF